MNDRRELATAELLGALAAAQLRAFTVAARAVPLAPDAHTAEVVARFAVREHAAYRRLRARLDEVTELSAAVLDRHRTRVDDFFDQAPMADWLSACVFFSVGVPLAADFSRQLAPNLDPATAEAVLDALTDRNSFVEFAAEQVGAHLGADGAMRERARSLVAEVIGRALTAFQSAVGDTDALHVLVAGDDGAGDAVRRLAITVLEQHRRRMDAMGLEAPD